MISIDASRPYDRSVSAQSLTWRIDLDALDAARARLPRLAQAFVALTVIGLLFRVLVWLLQALFHTDAAQQQTDIFVLHDLAILLPAIVLWRRPTAATAFPICRRGPTPFRRSGPAMSRRPTGRDEAPPGRR